MRSSSSPATRLSSATSSRSGFAGPGAGRTQRLVVGDVEVQVEPEPATAARRARPAIFAHALLGHFR